MTLPAIQGRLALPLVPTRHTARAEGFNRSPLETFIAEQAHAVRGEMILFKEFYDRFLEWLPAEERHSWTRQKLSRCLPVDHPSGYHTANKSYIANLSWEPKQPEPDAPTWIVNRDGKLCKENG